MKLVLIKKRPDFVHVTQTGFKAVRAGLILLAAKSRREFDPAVFRVGYTTSKKVGNAVCRSTVRRRFRALCAELLPKHAIVGYDYVLIGRKATLDIDHKKLYKELENALIQIQKDINGESQQPAASPSPAND